MNDEILTRLQNERAEALTRAAEAERRADALERRLAALEAAPPSWGAPAPRRGPKPPTVAGEMDQLAAAFERVPQLRRAVEDALEPQTKLNLRILEIEAKARSSDRLIGLLAVALPHAIGAISDRHGRELAEAIAKHEEQLEAASAVQVEEVS